MPLDKFDSHDFFYERCVSKKLCWSFLPRRCYISGKFIWFKKGYRLIAIYHGPGLPIHEYRWFDHKKYLLAIITGEIKWDH